MRVEQVNISEGSITTGYSMAASLFGLSLVAGNATSGIRFTECVYIPGGGGKWSLVIGACGVIVKLS